MGFQPLLPVLSTFRPTDLTWNKVVLVPPSLHPAQPALLDASFESWSYVGRLRGTGPGLDSLLAIEETTGSLDPLAGLNLGYRPSHIAQQYATTVSGEPAILFHIANDGAPANTYQAIEILWHVGSVTVRLLASSAGEPGAGYGVYDPRDAQNELDFIIPRVTGQPADVDAFWVHLAATMAPFTGCDH